jgi:hypothetical protein
MAMVGAGAINGWGQVGAWPALRIVSVRASESGVSGGFLDVYRQALIRCREVSRLWPVTVANIELAGARTPTASERSAFHDAVGLLRRRGINVMAATGNTGGAVNIPASLPDVFAVGASDRAGALCTFSSRGPELDLVTPGCDMDLASSDGREWLAQRGWGGTSASSMLAAAATTALRSYRPELTVEETEQLLRSTASRGTAPPMLDVEAAFRAAGLSHVVDAAHQRVPLAQPLPPPSHGHPSQELHRQTSGPPFDFAFRGALPKPRVSVHQRAGRVIFVADNRPRGVSTVVTVYRRVGRFRTSRQRFTRTSRRIETRRPWAWAEVRYEDVYGARVASPIVLIRPSSSLRRGGRGEPSPRTARHSPPAYQAAP